MDNDIYSPGIVTSDTVTPDTISPGSITILGVPISNVSMITALDSVGRWLRDPKPRYICACDVHSLMRAREDNSHFAALTEADMVLPDGMPLVWVSKLKGHGDIGRVCGPDFMLELCAQSARNGWTNYFYGGAEGVSEKLAHTLTNKYPGLLVAGFETPPFRQLTQQEHKETIARIKASNADIVWVGLGCPKQENWMRRNTQAFGGPLLIGVGAAFDFHTERVRRAPHYMRTWGLEWLHRLSSDPRRLWRRYLILAPIFLWLCGRDLLANQRINRRQK